MTKVLAICFLFTAALGLTAFQRGTPTFAPDCGGSCTAGVPVTFVGSGFQKNVDIVILSQGVDPMNPTVYSDVCSTDGGGNLICPASSFPADSYTAKAEKYSLHHSNETVLATDSFVVQ